MQIKKDSAKKTCGTLLYILTLSLSLALMGGCSIGQQSKPSQFYLLTAEQDRNGSNITVPYDVLGVGPINIPAYLDRPQIVVRNGQDVRISLEEFHRWGERFVKIFPCRCRNGSPPCGRPTAVVQYPAASNRHAEVWLTMEIGRLDGTVGKDATLDAWWSIVSRKGDLIHTKRFTKTLPVANNYESLVETESELLWLLVQDAVRVLQKK